jgi:hypothetical protein
VKGFITLGPGDDNSIAIFKVCENVKKNCSIFKKMDRGGKKVRATRGKKGKRRKSRVDLNGRKEEQREWDGERKETSRSVRKRHTHTHTQTTQTRVHADTDILKW